MRKPSSLGWVLLLGVLLVACPPPAGDDAGTGDAGPTDRAGTDTGTTEAGFDSGCSAACGTITVEGVCQGTLLRFCDNNCLVERDCATAAGGPFTCGLYGAFNECLAGLSQACEPDYWNCDPATTCNGNFPCDESDGLECSGGTSPTCIQAGTDAGMQDAATTSDAATGNDTAVASDASSPDQGTASDSAVTTDSTVSTDAATEDGSVATDSAVDTDAAMAVDAGTTDATTTDTAPLEDAGTADAVLEDATTEDI
ncbi:MAG: hypothetical protein ABIJ09_09605 [Pseudomonadota bacterium]